MSALTPITLLARFTNKIEPINEVGAGFDYQSILYLASLIFFKVPLFVLFFRLLLPNLCDRKVGCSRPGAVTNLVTLVTTPFLAPLSLATAVMLLAALFLLTRPLLLVLLFIPLPTIL